VTAGVLVGLLRPAHSALAAHHHHHHHHHDHGGGGEGGDGRQCGVMTCQPGWSCCRFAVGAGCYDPDYLRCCDRGLCSDGSECCGTAQCCTQGWHCCGGGQCCPNGWRCGGVACEAPNAARKAATRTMPFAKAVASDERVWIAKGWLQPLLTDER
jgi:hypothetical protein